MGGKKCFHCIDLFLADLAQHPAHSLAHQRVGVSYEEPVSPLVTLKISELANKYPKKYPKTDFFGYFSFVMPGNRQAGSCPTASGSVLVLAALLRGVVYFNNCLYAVK